MSDEGKTKPSRLGRGLSALIGEVEAVTPATAKPSETGSGGPTEIEIDKIRRNPKQPRRTFDEAALQELADSLKAKGVLQPILVRPNRFIRAS
jgi:ParB family chromosome partitioning protein